MVSDRRAGNASAAAIRTTVADRRFSHSLALPKPVSTEIA
jgi:hypothetical protein